jgi:DNA modification methylase
MKTLPDKSIDLFLCDLPYGCLTNKRGTRETGWGREGESKKIENMGCAWDIKIDLTEFWIQVERLMKDDHTPILHFCNTRFGHDLINSKPDWFRYDLVWNKMRGVGFLNANKMPMRSHENIYVFAKKGATYYRKDIEDESKKERKKNRSKALNGNVYNAGERLVEGNDTPAGLRCALSVIDGYNNANKKGKHPTQKPDDLYSWLIDRYSKEGDTILDPTAGSFASVFTAERMNRKAIGIEKDDAFYEKAKQNITEEQ